MFAMTDPETTFSSMEVADMVGITYRMLDYWLREGHVTLACDPSPGSGRRRSWTMDEVEGLRRYKVQYDRLLARQEEFRTGRVWDQAIREAESANA